MEDLNAQKSPAKSTNKLLWAAMTGLTAAVVVQWFQIHELKEQKQPTVSDSVVVVDFLQLAMGYDSKASEQDVERQMAQVNNTIRSLGENGLIVLDSKAVLSAPDDAYLHELLANLKVQ